MIITKRFVRSISPKLNKNELFLSLILFDLCNSSECLIGKMSVYKYKNASTTIRRCITHIKDSLVGKNIICDKKMAEKFVLFEEIKRDGCNFHVKLNKSLFYWLKMKTNKILIDDRLINKFNGLHPLKMLLLFFGFSCFDGKKHEFSVRFLKKYLNVENMNTGSFLRQYINKFVCDINEEGYKITIEKVYHKHDARFLKSIRFIKKEGN